MTRPETETLETLFAAARADPPGLSDRLLATLEAEALAAQPRVRRRWLAAIGGLTGLGSLVTATLAGVWIGVVGPEGLAVPVETMLGVDTAAVAEGFGPGWEWAEGDNG